MLAVSVIIPLYNAEQYIGECLESVLLQTFQSFEVIVVDDCSTDNSRKIAESYLEKFNGRLILSKTEKNSGGGGYVPRNKGLLLSHGEYVFFMDADDKIIPTALEELTALAKEYQADVVYCEKFYTSDDGTNLDTKTNQVGDLVKAPTLEAEDLKERVKNIVSKRYLTVPWNKLVRRRLIMENENFFPLVKTSGDNIWNQGLLFCAKKFLRVPNVVYIYRRSVGSAQRKEKTPQQTINFWLNPVLLGLKTLDNLMSRHEFFSANPDCRLTILKKFVEPRLDLIMKSARELKEEDIYSTIKDAFGERLGKYDVLISTLCTVLYNAKKNQADAKTVAQTLSRKLQDDITARVDIKLMSTEGDFQIVSISDDKADVKKPNWFNRDGVGYVIQSCNGNMKFIAKANVDGKISLSLKGLDIRTPEDNSKRVPYWIYYTKFSINDKIVFNEITPAWHDEPFNYTFDARAGEEIKIQAEWLPHTGDVKIIAPPPQKSVEPIADKFLPYLTGRVDLQLKPKGAGDLQIVNVSDERASVWRPDWFQKGGIGYQIQTYASNIELIAKSTVDGQLTLNLRGLDIRTPEDYFKRIPYRIDYTKLTVNGKIIFDKLTPVWHNEPYEYNLDVKAGEEIKIQAEWLPHRSDT